MLNMVSYFEGEHKLQVPENILFKKIFLTKQNEVHEQFKTFSGTSQYRQVKSYFRKIKYGRLRLAKHVARMGVTKYTYKILVEKSLGKHLI
jgi:hypothetical protein